MIDAAAVGINLVDVVTAFPPTDDPSVPEIVCVLDAADSASLSVIVTGAAGGLAQLIATSVVQEAGPGHGVIKSGARLEGLTVGQAHACRAQVLQSFV